MGIKRLRLLTGECRLEARSSRDSESARESRIRIKGRVLTELEEEDALYLVCAPPDYGELDPQAQGLFRFFLDDEGFVKGMLMHQKPCEGRPGVTRISWSYEASTSDPLWQAMTQYAGAGLDPHVAFQFLQHEQSVTWGGWHTCSSRGVRLTMGDIDVARQWIQGLTDDTAPWAVDNPVPPRRIDKEGWDPIPDDGSYILIDAVTGWVFDESSVVAPLPVGEAYEPFMADKAALYRMNYGFEYGLKLGMPGSRGIALTDIDAEAREYVLIDLDNGNCTAQVRETVLALKPDDMAGYDDLVYETDLAKSHAVTHGLVPVAPYGIRALGEGAYELGP